MAPVIFTGVSMRAILLAAAAAIWAGQAGARIVEYRFTGTGDILSVDISGGPLVSYEASYDFYDWYDEDPDREDCPKLDLPIVSFAGLESCGVEEVGVRISMDQKFNLVDLYMWGEFSGTQMVWTKNAFQEWLWYEIEPHYEVDGRWVRVSPVPLPATAPMLLIGAGLLTALRRRVKG